MASPRTRRLLKRLLVIALLLFAGLNAVAFAHAWAMTHFSASGPRTRRPQLSGLWDKAVVLMSGVNLPRPRDHHTPASVGLPYEGFALTTPDGVHLEGGAFSWVIPGAPCCSFTAMGLRWPTSSTKPPCFTVWAETPGWWTCAERVPRAATRRAWATTRPRTWRRHAGRWSTPGKALSSCTASPWAALRPCAVAVEGVRPSGMILENPFSSLLATVQNRYHSFGLPAFPFAELLVFWGGTQQRFWALSHNPEEYARSVTCPTLILVGERDTDATPEQAARIAHNAQVRCRLAILPSLGHVGLLNADRPEVMGPVQGLLGTVSGR